MEREHESAPDFCRAPGTGPAITTHNQGNRAIRRERWRSIRYADGSEELHDLENDPQEWHNLAGNPESVAVIAEHAKWLPAHDAPLAPGDAHRIVTYDPVSDNCTVEGVPIKRTDPLPISTTADTIPADSPEPTKYRNPR